MPFSKSVLSGAEFYTRIKKISNGNIKIKGEFISSAYALDMHCYFTFDCIHHGEFKQIPLLILNGITFCPLCAESGLYTKPDISDHNDTWLYFIRLNREGSPLYKIGTTADLDRRMTEFPFPLDILYAEKMTEMQAFVKEQIFLADNNGYVSDTTGLTFGGKTECFDPSVIEHASLAKSSHALLSEDKMSAQLIFLGKKRVNRPKKNMPDCDCGDNVLAPHACPAKIILENKRQIICTCCSECISSCREYANDELAKRRLKALELPKKKKRRKLKEPLGPDENYTCAPIESKAVITYKKKRIIKKQ